MLLPAHREGTTFVCLKRSVLSAIVCAMRWLIASDIHGSAFYCNKLIERFYTEGADRILLLGDILYHGPRNELPREYEPKRVAAALNDVCDKIACVRGNCDSEVDQMMLDFPIMAEYAILDIGKVLIFATHGHVFGEQNPPKFAKNSLLLCGHFHVPVVRKHEDYLYINAGSVSLPKDGSWHSYIVFDGERFSWKDLNAPADVENLSLDLRLDF